MLLVEPVGWATVCLYFKYRRGLFTIKKYIVVLSSFRDPQPLSLSLLVPAVSTVGCRCIANTSASVHLCLWSSLSKWGGRLCVLLLIWGVVRPSMFGSKQYMCSCHCALVAFYIVLSEGATEEKKGTAEVIIRWSWRRKFLCCTSIPETELTAFLHSLSLLHDW